MYIPEKGMVPLKTYIYYITSSITYFLKNDFVHVQYSLSENSSHLHDMYALCSPFHRKNFLHEQQNRIYGST